MWQCAICSVVVVLAMLGLSVAWKKRATLLASIRVPFNSNPGPRRVSGD